MLADLALVAGDARARGNGLGAFNVVHLEDAEQFAAAAERAGVPLVLQVSQNAVAYHGRLAPLGRGVVAVAQASDAEVVVHLDHATDPALIDEAFDIGFTSAMFDGSLLRFEDNVRVTREVAARAHRRGAAVEAELGRIGGKGHPHDPTTRTDPAEAAEFIQRTGVDLLAVAVGTSHAMDTRTAAIDTGLIGELARSSPIPLVLHGSSGVSDEGLVMAIRAGITKVNVSTHFKRVLTSHAALALRERPGVVDSRIWFGDAAEAAGREAERLLRMFDVTSGASSAEVAAR